MNAFVSDLENWVTSMFKGDAKLSHLLFIGLILAIIVFWIMDGTKLLSKIAGEM